MQNYYEILVTHKGCHYFATAPRSFTDAAATERAVADFRNRFPESEGFAITCAYWKASGTTQNF